MPRDGSKIDMAPLFYTHALSLASRLLFDEPLASLNPEFASSSERFIEAFIGVNKGHEMRFRMGRLLPLQPYDRNYKASLKVVHEYGGIFVQKALRYRKAWQKDGIRGNEGSEGRYIFVREIAKENDDPIYLRNCLLGMLLVGSETTASLLTSCLSPLSSKQALWAKMRSEVLEIGDPSYKRVKALTTLNQVINEGGTAFPLFSTRVLTSAVLRLYPILPMFGRMANKDTLLPTGGGPDGKSRVFVPKDIIV